MISEFLFTVLIILSTIVYFRFHNKCWIKLGIEEDYVDCVFC